MNLCGIEIIYSLIFLLSVHKSNIDAVTCNESLTSNLRDDQFTASSVYSADYNASSAKFNEGGWVASENNAYQYLQIDLEGLCEITSIITQDIDKWWYWYATQAFRIFHSKDGLTWTAYNTYLSDEILGETFNRQDKVTTIQFNPTIKVIYFL
ncbi:lactadherin-like [Mytilus californianus]|uniref:lactadherin-like n=1 Tax=Mytilus californianus TaxID=6549 RepID=UPI0022484F1D|nr:lactadherin-like [Mytilus californianus]